MKTLTITDAKKSLGHWLRAAAEGEDIGIVSGADIIALRKVEVTPVADDYAYAVREYGVTRDEMRLFEERMDRDYLDSRKKKRTARVTSRKELEEVLKLEGATR